MIERFLFVWLIISVLGFPEHSYAQFTDAHNYDNTPVGVNQIELSYAYSHGNASVDTSLIITGGKLNLDQGMISYTRYFGLANRLTWVSAGVRYCASFRRGSLRNFKSLMPHNAVWERHKSEMATFRPTGPFRLLALQDL